MEWQLVLVVFVGGVLFLMLTGLPIAFCFMLVSIIGVILFWGGEAGLLQLITSTIGAVSSFKFLAIPLFVLMGEVMFHSGMAPLMLSVLDKWMGRLAGRLGLLAVGAGTLMSTLTGTSIASIAVLGSLLVPEMEQRGYRKPMSLGPILGSGGLAVMIPPSGLAVFIGAIGEISIGRLLIAIIIPGLIMAALYAMYIVVRCRIQPFLAPAYKVEPAPLLEKLVATLKYVLPLGLIVFLVVGVIFLGVATPSEAAATGAMGCFILAAAYRTLDWGMTKKAFIGTINVTVMVFMIVVGATAFSQILATSGVGQGLAVLTMGLPLGPVGVIIVMLIVLIFLGMVMSVVGIIMITLPIFLPVALALGFDPVWFGVVFLLILEVAITSPPFGMGLFVMKGVASPDTTTGDIVRAALPFIGCDLMVIALLLAFPTIALWLPSMMY